MGEWLGACACCVFVGGWVDFPSWGGKLPATGIVQQDPKNKKPARAAVFSPTTRFHHPPTKQTCRSVGDTDMRNGWTGKSGLACIYPPATHSLCVYVCLSLSMCVSLAALLLHAGTSLANRCVTLSRSDQRKESKYRHVQYPDHVLHHVPDHECTSRAYPASVFLSMPPPSPLTLWPVAVY